MNSEVKELQQVPAKKSLLAKMAGRFDMEPGMFADTIRATVMPGGKATNEQLAAFLMVAEQYQLNPITREIHAFPGRGGGITPVVGIDGFLNLAQRRPEFDGMSFEIGTDTDGKLESCTCTIHRKDRSHPIVITEYLEECFRATEPWKQHTRRMLRHKTAKEAIRYAFGFSGISDEDDAHFIHENATVIEQEAPSLGAASIMSKAKALDEQGQHPSEEPAKDATESSGWPRFEWDVHSEIWRDVDGVEFDEQLHGWNQENDRPSVTQAGRFRKRRGHQEEAIESEPTMPAHPATFAEIADEIRAAKDEEQLGMLSDLIAESTSLPDDQRQELLEMVANKA